jgi:ribonuclease HI
MAIEEKDHINIRKTRMLRKLLDQEGGNVSVIWVSVHKGTASNEQADI